ncbi:hypothetical protein KEJ27_09785 [Candidatus Bathyarchaeota archaeon]|nr:hypothetical protein [Candidatus Bathyarchaeota archaeon]
MTDDSLPGCIGYFSNPITPNDCQKCKYVQLCRSVIARELLKPLLPKLEEIKKILKWEAE